MYVIVALMAIGIAWPGPLASLNRGLAYNSWMYIDSHCHINFPELAARMPEILAKMAENKVTHALCVSVDLPDFPGVLALAEQYPHIYASVGVHPDYEDTPEPSVEQLVELAAHPKIVAIGETGLDYYRLEEIGRASCRERV